MRLIFASHNAHKVSEIKKLIDPRYVVQSLSDLDDHEEIAETGETIEENSLIKAQEIFKKHGLPTIADDSGLEVDTLNGEPGVYSARYAGPEKSDQNNLKKLLANLEGSKERGAQFKTVITYFDQSGYHQFEGIVRGNITLERKGEGGFGYDPIFIPEGREVTFAEMSASEKNKISHRGLATQKLLEFLSSIS